MMLNYVVLGKFLYFQANIIVFKFWSNFFPWSSTSIGNVLVEPLNKGHIEIRSTVPCRKVVLI